VGLQNHEQSMVRGGHQDIGPARGCDTNMSLAGRPVLC
jgi:hypothetical protein